MERRLSVLVVGCLATLAPALLVLSLSHARPGIELNRRSIYSANGDAGPYDPRPDHLWNRLHRHFFIRVARDGRQFGVDELDPLLWIETKYLISGPSHQQALALLDEFVATKADKLIADPLKRAMLQRDLWAIFDWLSVGEDSPSARDALQARLAKVIRRLALTSEQIRLLPDNYAAAVNAKSFPTQYHTDDPETAFLPPDLLRADSPWILIGDRKGRLTAPVHTASSPFGGRSTFLILIRLPGGREATLSYLQRLSDFPRPWISNPESSRDLDFLVPNPDLPQFPAGTQVALVRRMVLIDSEGNLVPTSLTESVQLRVYRSIPAGTGIRSDEARRTQDVCEFTLSRRKLLDGTGGGIREVLRDEKSFTLFRSHGIDWFERAGDPEIDRSPALNQCANCHASPGIHSVLSYQEQRFQRPAPPPAFVETTIANQEQLALGWKRCQYEFGLLRGLWQAVPG